MTVIDNAFDAIIQVNTRGSVTIWSKAAEKIFGYSKQEAMGRVIFDLIIPDRAKDFHKKELKTFLEKGRGTIFNKQVEITLKRRDDSEFSAEATITPQKKDDGYSFTAIFRDITQRKKARDLLVLGKEELHQKKEELEKIVKDLHEKTGRLERYKKLTVGRELDMVELKKEINALLDKQGRPKKYSVPEGARE